MGRYLRYGGFRWLKKADGLDINSISKKSLIGYILELDRKYLDQLHVLQNDYPLAAEKLAIPYNMLSNCCKQYEIKVGDVKKLIPNLGNETNYVLHYKKRQLYFYLGMELGVNI